MKHKRILCLLSDVGGAHVRLAGVFREGLGNDFDFKVIDLFKEASRFCNRSLQLYSRVLLGFPRFYNLFYALNDRKPIWDLTYSLFIRTLMKEKTKRIIREERPDAVLSLFALTSRIAADSLGELGLARAIPLVIFVVDPLSVHRSWIEPRARLYLVASRESEAFLVANGVRRETVRLIRYPVGESFGEKHDARILRQRYGIGESRRTVLIMGGGEGIVPADAIARTLLDGDDETHVIAVAGKNRDLYSRLHAMRGAVNGRLTALGYSDHVHELMALSDVIVTKPGPSTIMEAVECRLPIIVTGFITGQERGNVDFLVSNGLGVHLDRRDYVRIRDYVRDEQWLEKTRANMESASSSFTAPKGFDEIRRLMSDRNNFHDL